MCSDFTKHVLLRLLRLDYQFLPPHVSLYFVCFKILAMVMWSFGFWVTFGWRYTLGDQFGRIWIHLGACCCFRLGREAIPSRFQRFQRSGVWCDGTLALGWAGLVWVAGWQWKGNNKWKLGTGERVQGVWENRNVGYLAWESGVFWGKGMRCCGVVGGKAYLGTHCSVGGATCFCSPSFRDASTG